MNAETVPMLIRCTHCLELGKVGGTFPNSQRLYCIRCACKNSWYPFHLKPKRPKLEVVAKSIDYRDIKGLVAQYIDDNPELSRAKIINKIMKETDSTYSKVVRAVNYYEKTVSRVKTNAVWEEVIEKFPADKEMVFGEVRKLFPHINKHTLRSALFTLASMGKMQTRREGNRILYKCV